MVTSSPGLIAGSYVLHRLLTPRHPSRALVDLIASTECRGRFTLLAQRLPERSGASWPSFAREGQSLNVVDSRLRIHHVNDSRLVLSTGTCLSLMCSFISVRLLTASKHQQLLGSSQYRDTLLLHASFGCQRLVPRLACGRTWRGKDSDSSPAVNAVARSVGKFPFREHIFVACVGK